MVCKSHLTSPVRTGRLENRKIDHVSMPNDLMHAIESPTPNVEKLDWCFVDRVSKFISSDNIDIYGKEVKIIFIHCKCYNLSEDLYSRWVLSNYYETAGSSEPDGCLKYCLSQQLWKRCASPPKITARNTEIITRDCCSYCNMELLDTQVITKTADRIDMRA